MEHGEKVLEYLKDKIIVPREWKYEDVSVAYTKNMLIHPYDTRRYIIAHKETGKKVYAQLTKEQLKSLEDKKEVLSWKNVFNGELHFYSDVFSCFEIVKEAGYDYFTFNKQVFMVLKDNSFVETDYKIEEIN